MGCTTLVMDGLQQTRPVLLRSWSVEYCFVVTVGNEEKKWLGVEIIACVMQATFVHFVLASTTQDNRFTSRPRAICSWHPQLRTEVVLLLYPKPTPKPRFFAKTVHRRNLGFFPP